MSDDKNSQPVDLKIEQCMAYGIPCLASMQRVVKPDRSLVGLGHHSVGGGVKIKVMYTYNSRSVDDTLSTLA